MSVSSAQQLNNIDALDGFRDRQQRTLKRNLSSGACIAAWSGSVILPHRPRCLLIRNCGTFFQHFLKSCRGRCLPFALEQVKSSQRQQRGDIAASGTVVAVAPVRPHWCPTTATPRHILPVTSQRLAT